MVFKRNYRRGPRPQGWKRRAPLARVRRTWIQSMLIDPCDPQVVPLCVPAEQGLCCTTRFVEVLVDNQVLQSQFSDRARVRRSLVDLNIGFDPRLTSNPEENYARLSACMGSMYVQLLKRPINGSGNTELPPEIWDSTSVIEGYSESKALKSWWHHWNPFNGFKTDLSFPDGSMVTNGIRPKFTDCATGAETSLFGTIASGTGAFGSAPACTGTPADGVKLSGDCVACGELDFSSLTAHSSALGTPASWHFRADIKKRIPLREDEQLVLDFQFRTQFVKVFTDGSLVILGGGIKTLLEY